MENPNSLPVSTARKRHGSPSRSFRDYPKKDHRQQYGQASPRGQNHPPGGEVSERKEQESFAREQTRRNQNQEAEQMREWVSKEDEFVLRQSKKKAHIRVKEGRARSIDWLAVTLDAVDPYKDLLEDEDETDELDVVDPAGIFEGLNVSQLQELGKEIESYLILESKNTNRKYWEALKVICNNYQSKLAPNSHQRGSNNSIAADVDKLLAPKSSQELELLEVQVLKKLQSDEPIDVERWEEFLASIKVYNAKAALSKVYKSIITNRLNEFRHEQSVEAARAAEKLSLLLSSSGEDLAGKTPSFAPQPADRYIQKYDPEPLLKLRLEDKGLDTVEESSFIDSMAADRRKVQILRYVPPRQLHSNRSLAAPALRSSISNPHGPLQLPSIVNDDFSQATTALYEREVARGVQENEEIFAGEEEISSSSKPQWAGKYRPRKPRYFNRVQMGYEWNKYNQTHYDHDNPPPKVVQGYKFNIFYPDLIDKAKAPTYRIERENGRKKGQSFAPAGEEDTCLIRFISGPPYEDLAFRIVDKEWDYSAKRERGFRSSFDKGILQLHFQFKKVYYRK